MVDRADGNTVIAMNVFDQLPTATAVGGFVHAIGCGGVEGAGRRRGDDKIAGSCLKTTLGQARADRRPVSAAICCLVDTSSPEGDVEPLRIGRSDGQGRPWTSPQDRYSAGRY